jgi:hypothetical protein
MQIGGCTEEMMKSMWYKGAFNKYLFYTANTMVIEPTFWYM